MKLASLSIVAVCLAVIYVPDSTPVPNKPTVVTPKKLEVPVEPRKALIDPIASETILEPSAPKVEVDNYQPRWDVEGDYSRANDRNSLIVHLSGPNHNFTLQRLNSMSTDELQRLHDQDHEKKRAIQPFRFWRRR